MSINKLFVYGTLAPDRENAHILKPIQGKWYKASMRGLLLPNGWGAALGYPAIIPKDSGEIVHGQIFESDDLDQHWQRIDEFEGEGYQRLVVQVLVESEKGDFYVDAYVYALNGMDERIQF
ncbi:MULTISPECIES: gamma-glutamylcyclotransferase family protein [unclassified Acinetobacter]|uniref:gamma-glutamylcyclotransferase family protein n=1 Tax=unclassified Acinetobacter TaxID=196816 RepID=UPI0035B88F7C